MVGNVQRDIDEHTFASSSFIPLATHMDCLSRKIEMQCEIMASSNLPSADNARAR